jgi:hypothetical protein
MMGGSGSGTLFKSILVPECRYTMNFECSVVEKNIYLVSGSSPDPEDPSLFGPPGFGSVILEWIRFRNFWCGFTCQKVLDPGSFMTLPYVKYIFFLYYDMPKHIWRLTVQSNYRKHMVLRPLFNGIERDLLIFCFVLSVRFYFLAWVGIESDCYSRCGPGPGFNRPADR